MKTKEKQRVRRSSGASSGPGRGHVEAPSWTDRVPRARPMTAEEASLGAVATPWWATWVPLLALVVHLGACTPTQAPSSDAGESVCAHLVDIGCPQPSSCAAVFDRAQGRLTDLKPDCLLAAKTPAAASACGSVRCGDAGP